MACLGSRLSCNSLPKGSARVNTVRVYQDANFVFAHTDYNFFGPKVGFDIFRFEDGRSSNIGTTCRKPPPSESQRPYMLDGPTIASDLDKTEATQGADTDLHG